METKRYRLRLGAVLMAVSLGLGCQAPGAIEPSNALDSQPRVLVNYGKMKIEKETDLAISMTFMDILSRGYRVQNFVVDGVQRIVATVTGPNLAAPIVQEVQTVDCPSGEATFNFLKLAPGPVHVRIDVIDGAGNVVAWADGDTIIRRGETAVLELDCTVNAGDLQVIFKCPDLCGSDPTPVPTPTPTPAPSATPSASPSPSPTPVVYPFDPKQQPYFIDIDPSGNLWVTNSNKEEISKFSPSGDFIGSYKTGIGTGADWGLTTDPSGNVWVGVWSGSRVVKLSGEGAVLRTSSTSWPAFLAASASGEVWVSNSRADSISKFAPDGTISATFPIGGYADGLAVDSTGSIWVTLNDGGYGLKKFSPDGTLLGSFLPGDYAYDVALDGAGNAWVASATNNNVDQLGPDGSLLGTFTIGPAGGHRSIDVSSSGMIWVTNDVDKSVTKYNPVANTSTKYPVGGSPHYLDVSASGTAWVTVDGKNTPIAVGP